MTDIRYELAHQQDLKCEYTEEQEIVRSGMCKTKILINTAYKTGEIGSAVLLKGF